MKKISYGLKHIFLILVSLLSVFPFIWMVISVTNDSKDITMGKLTLGNAFMENVKKAFEMANIGQAFWNSTQLALIITLTSIIICSLAGYAFVIFPSKRKEFVFVILIASMMVPFAARIIPMFRMFAKVNLLNSYWAIILPAIGAPFLVFYFKQNTHAFPSETIQAARVDGCKEYQIFFRIFVPMMKSTYASAAIFAFMASWNNYMWPLIALQSNDKFTLPLMISNLAAGFNPDYGVIMVGIVISTLPTVFVFFLLQRQFVEGVIGATK